MKNYQMHSFSFSLLLLLSPPVSSAQEGCFVIARSGLNLRAAPEIKAKVLATIPFGEKVSELNNDPIQKDDKYREFVVEGKSGHWQYVEYKQQKGWVFSGFLHCGNLFADPGPGELNRDWVLIPKGAVCSSIHYRRDFQWYALVRNGLRSSLQKTNIRFRFADEFTEAEKSDGDFSMSVDLDIPADSVLFLIGTKKPLQEGPLPGNFTAHYWGYSAESVFLYPEMTYAVHQSPRSFTFKGYEDIRLHPDAENGYYRRFKMQCSVASLQGDITFDISEELDLTESASEHAKYLTPQLIWHGDLGRDGWPDFIFYSHSMSQGCGVSWYYHLFLSDPSNPKKPLKKVADLIIGACI